MLLNKHQVNQIAAMFEVKGVDTVSLTEQSEGIIYAHQPLSMGGRGRQIDMYTPEEAAAKRLEHIRAELWNEINTNIDFFSKHFDRATTETDRLAIKNEIMIYLISNSLGNFIDYEVSVDQYYSTGVEISISLKYSDDEDWVTHSKIIDIEVNEDVCTQSECESCDKQCDNRIQPATSAHPDTCQGADFDDMSDDARLEFINALAAVMCNNRVKEPDCREDKSQPAEDRKIHFIDVGTNLNAEKAVHDYMNYLQGQHRKAYRTCN